MFDHAVLHVDLAFLVARERCVQAGQVTIREQGRIQALLDRGNRCGCTALAEEEPVLARVAARTLPLVEKKREGAMPVPGPIITIGAEESGRDTRLFVLLDVNRYPLAHRERDRREQRRADVPTLPVAGTVRGPRRLWCVPRRMSCRALKRWSTGVA